MTKLVAWLLFFGLFTIQTGGQMNSDPAPGRSPGPPAANIPIPVEESHTTRRSTHARDENSRERQHRRRSLAAPDAGQQIKLDNSVIVTTYSYSNATTTARRDNLSTDINFELGKIESSQIENNDRNEIVGSSSSKRNNSVTNFVDAGDAAAASMNSSRGHSSVKSSLHSISNDFVSCHQDRDFKTADMLQQVREASGSDGQQRSGDPNLDIQLQLEHDIFESDAFGIVCGLMYRVRLSVLLSSHQSPDLTASSSATASIKPSTSTSSSSSHASSTRIPHTSSPRTSAFKSFYLAEFLVETFSHSTGRERGSFISNSLGHKLPISWFTAAAPAGSEFSGGSSKSRSDNQDYAVSEEAAAAVAVPYSAEHNTSSIGNIASPEASSASPNNQWTPSQGNEEASLLSRKTNEQRHRENGERMAKECPDNKWHGSLQGSFSGVGSTTPPSSSSSHSLWMVNELCEQEDIIEFRILFRAHFRDTGRNESNSSAGDSAEEQEAARDAQNVVLKKNFIFKLFKDCQLQLRESAAGTLDYTMLPLYSTQCIVHFPSYQLRTNISGTSSSVPSPGVLVELQRLNVPCNSGAGGFLQFYERHKICGKLEDLSQAERMYHFNVRNRNTSVRIVGNPMFSLSYKLVDHCYNVSSRNQTGEFYVTPTMRNTLECFFRIHLPHGNRLLLRLVANNDSSILPAIPFGGGSNDAQELPKEIYTSLGRSIQLQTINLTMREHSRNRLNTMPLSFNHSHPPPPPPPLQSSSSSSNLNSPGEARLGAYKTFADFFSERDNAKAQLKSLATLNCAGIVVKVFENDFAKWSHCVADAQIQDAFVLESSSNSLSIHLYRPPAQSGLKLEKPPPPPPPFSLPTIYLAYEARPIPEIVSHCNYGWIAMQQFCVSALEIELPWPEAEQTCVALGGHLVSIRNDVQQQVIDEMLLNSPGYEQHHAYWVGGSDKNFEGDFRWSDGLPFQYTNWFPGWSQLGHYNKQPNDDGLSSQDCIELRRYFRAPPGMQSSERNPLARNFMWNDRDCNAKNFIICEQAMSDDAVRRSWISDCNKTVSLTKEHPRASVWSPSFPRQYPDNANCFTTITAPDGYRIVIEFEELVIESEPGCTYDYLEISEPLQADFSKIPKSSKHPEIIKGNNNNNNNNNARNNTNNNNNKNSYINLRKRRSYENLSLSSYTSATYDSDNSKTTNLNNYRTNNNNNNNNIYSNNYYNNYNIAQTNYHNLLNVFSTLYKPHTNFLIQTPDYPKGNPYYTARPLRSDKALPKRLCGDWSSKLKLLRHVSGGSYLGLHFVSDYSHHFGGYKAKTYMENRSPSPHAASECANERLKPYNGSCYLIVSYPEVDWRTAQQVCRGMGATLSSVSSADEHRFITANIRNQIDYSPQLIYWLGAELERSGHFEWTDDTKMSFQGWLPGQGQFDTIPSDATCLGLQWKMSPTPMLPSGLYWQSQKCNKVGGYVCKKPKESFGRFAFNNFTVTGTEGRLVSPAYPNAYPLNVDYWVHIKAPERTRIVVQFQKIDLEPQDECLYDFVSIENYELVSKITLEPGTNPIPMAMLMSYEVSHDDEMGLFRHNLRRTGRSVSATISRKTPSRRVTGMSFVPGRRRMVSQKDEVFVNDNVIRGDKKTITSANFPKRVEVNAKVNENPKRRRRKGSFRDERIKIANKWQTQYLHENLMEYSSLSEERPVVNRQQHQQRKRRRKRSAASVADGGGGVLDQSRAVNAQSFLPYVRWCGSHDSNMSKFDFVSSSNQAVLNFHSDFSVTGLGFAAIWKAIDISGCPLQTLTSREGTIVSPNFPHFLLNSLNCAYVIQAPVGRRVWLEFIDFDMLSDAVLDIDIGHGSFRPFRLRQHINDGIFVSIREQLRVQFRTGQHPRGKGFQAVYHTVGQLEKRERVIAVSENITGYLYHLNYPHDMPDHVDFTQNLIAPFGDNVLLELHGVEFSENGCPDNSVLEIYDNYADNNGTKWQLCKYQNSGLHIGNVDDDDGYEQSLYGTHRNSARFPGLESVSRQQKIISAPPPVYITSYLNTLHIRQRATARSTPNLNATVRIQFDNNYKMKLSIGEKSVESCQPNPCQFKGKCVTSKGISSCQCQGHYTGRFCGLNLCELEPCIFGRCELTATNFKCLCQPGYMGIHCEQKQSPCADNPCEGRGICYEKSGGFFCRCHAWWEGHRCERRMLRIPYKPLSERMLQEPFWLGLITVFVVLAVIGLVWCAKRHFPEKIEKLLAEEADRNRPPGSIHGHHHHTSLREQLQFTTAIPQTATNAVPGAPRSIFNRLGSPSPRKKRNNSTPVKKNAAEKKQILQQLVSPAGPALAPSPKVSLGELISMTENRLRLKMADSESDLKETTLSENSAASLASSSVARVMTDPKLEKKVTFARLLNKVSAEMSTSSDVDLGQMRGKRNSSALSLPTDIQLRASSTPPSPCANNMRSPHSTSSNHGSDSLSSSDLAMDDLSLQCGSNGGGGGGGGGVSRHRAGITSGFQRHRFGASASTTTTTRPKVSSADSILAMFRSFASPSTPSSNTASMQANNTTMGFVSPSTTPTISSPQDDIPGDDDSSTSSISMHTPVSFCSGPPDSPLFYRPTTTTIEVPVLDALTAHKSASSLPSSSSASSNTANLLHPPTILLEIPSAGINNKCLSPIHEMPTPIPSPALTPIMNRPPRSNSPIFQEEPLSADELSDDDNKSDRSDTQLSDEFMPRLRRNKCRNMETVVDTEPAGRATTTGIALADMTKQPDPSKATLSALSMRSAAPLSAASQTVAQLSPVRGISIGLEPPTPDEKIGTRPRDLVIPTLTVEQPSPTRSRHPKIIFPGSPPPQRASIGETSFMFPNKQQQKRLLKHFEKPASLEFPFAPPTITVTSNMSELESDGESLSPTPKISTAGSLMPPNPVAMSYLSPFTMGPCRADRTISESNLSSSGYSSMASPGPSRCGSSNPLCPNEMDEPGSGHSSAGLSLHMSLLNRRRSSALASCKENIANGKGSEAGGVRSNATEQPIHQRSDSETFSDEILVESNDEGIGTDHIDEKLEDCRRLSDYRRQEMHLLMEGQALIEVEEPPAQPPSITLNCASNQMMAQLQLPQIVIQIDGNDKGLSPVSSRSESPLSERASIGRFSPHFYGRKDQLPFTDSDGLYDFPSSDGKGVSAHPYSHQRRSSSKKRERKSSKCAATQSPTKHQLDIPPSKSDSLNTPSSSGSTHVCNKHCNSYHHPCPITNVTARKSPKRRLIGRHPVATSSSSSESLISTKELAKRSLPRRLNSPNRERRPRKQDSLSEDEVADELLRRISPSIVKDEGHSTKPKCKINRLRAIGNQIRFLRRLEKSIKTRERLVSLSDSCPEENTDDVDSPQATSPLLQSPSPSKTRLSLCRQRRLPAGAYGITATALNSDWKGMDRSLIDDDLNSD